MRIESMSDDAIAAKIGQTVKTYRLRRNLTQEEMGLKIGVSKPTVAELEHGRAKLGVLIAALRVLRRLDLLAHLLEEPPTSPLRTAKQVRHTRLRASPTKESPATARAIAQRTMKSENKDG